MMIYKKQITAEEQAWKDKAYGDRIKNQYLPLLLLAMLVIVYIAAFGPVG